MNNKPVALTQVEIMEALTLGIPLYTQDQLEEARKLGMQQERAMWELAASTQEIMDTHPVKAQNKPVAYKAWHEDLGWTYHDWKDGFTAEGVIPLYTHPAPTKVKFASDSCESGWIYLENTHPVKEFFEDEPQAEELHEIMQSNTELTEDWQYIAQRLNSVIKQQQAEIEEWKRNYKDMHNLATQAMSRVHELEKEQNGHANKI